MTGGTAAPNLSSTSSGYAVSGDRAALLRMMFNLYELTVTVAWSCSYSFPPSPTLFYSSFNQTMSCKNPPALAGTTSGFYYTTTSGGPPSAPWTDPASRVLAIQSGTRPMPNPSSEMVPAPNQQTMSVEFRPSFDGTNFKVAGAILISDVNNAISTDMAGTSGTVLATTSLSLYGMTFPVYLAINSGGPVSATFSTPFTVTGTIAFHPTS